MKILAKVSLVSACILVVIVLVLVLPLYATPRGQIEEIGEVFALQKSVDVDGLFSGDYYSTAIPIWWAHLGSAHLESGWNVSVTVDIDGVGSTDTSVGIMQDFGRKVSVFVMSGSGTGFFIVPETGVYAIEAADWGSYDATVRDVRLSASRTNTSCDLGTAPFLGYLGRQAVLIIALLAVACLGLLAIAYLGSRTPSSSQPQIQPSKEIEVDLTHKFCRECGSKRPLDSKYCEGCGRRFE